MRTSSLVLTTLLCASTSVMVFGFVRAPFFEAPACGGDGEPEMPAAENGLAGQVLVANPRLEDPYFEGTMIFMLIDGAGGALGVVLNRPLDDVRPGQTVWDGGPVGRDRIFLLHNDLQHDGSIVVGDVAVAAEPALINDVLDGHGPAHARVFVGYAGWAPGQLAAELDAGVWQVVDPTPSMIFDP